MNIETRNLVLTFTGDSQFIPSGIRENTEYAVIGFDTRNRKVSFSDPETKRTQRKDKTDVFFMVINDEGRLTRIMDSNCYLKQVSDDDLPF